MLIILVNLSFIYCSLRYFCYKIIRLYLRFKQCIQPGFTIISFWNSTGFLFFIVCIFSRLTVLGLPFMLWFRLIFTPCFSRVLRRKDSYWSGRVKKFTIGGGMFSSFLHFGFINFATVSDAFYDKAQTSHLHFDSFSSVLTSFGFLSGLL
jgi:hypothetical protein